MLKCLKKLIIIIIFIYILANQYKIVHAFEDNKDNQYNVRIYYTVQKGDTLWDLSKRFSDSPFKWPGLWSENPKILNPHVIYPNERILLFDGKWDNKLDDITKKPIISKKSIPDST